MNRYIGRLRALGYTVPAITLMVRYVRSHDPWVVLEHPKIPKQLFGPGSLHPFQWYLDGISSVSVATPGDICSWLFECRYALDITLFQEADFWQHPVTFEKLRQGDCEDHSMWAWRKLRELGLEPEFFCGQASAGPDGMN